MTPEPSQPDPRSRPGEPWRARLAANLGGVRDRIRAAAEAAGRAPDAVRLVAVTKHVEPRVARALVELGVRDLGENRAEGLAEKVAALADLDVRWHFLGHLQRNKVRRVLPHLAALHSLDSARLVDVLAAALDAARAEGRAPAGFGAFLQVKWTAEAAKTGLAPDEVARLVDAARAADLPLLGLMSMGVAEDPERTARIFASTAALAEELPADAFVAGRPQLSMGMSGDLESAIAQGSDLVRVGSDLFVGLPLDDEGRLVVDPASDVGAASDPRRTPR